jgi:alginate O-acetyltransferase complex protein AlgI
MSLGTWFRDYVYIPMGGNRVPLGRWFFNTLTVWFLTGFWHGADWTFIVWGLYFAAFLLMEKFFLNKFFAKIPRVFSHVYVIVAILISFVIFNANGMGGALSDLRGLFGGAGLPFSSGETLYYLRSYAPVLVLGLVGATPWPKQLAERASEHRIAGRVLNLLEPVVLVGLMVVMTAYLVDGSFNPFLYFRF